jgi:hypothetical protein
MQETTTVPEEQLETDGTAENAPVEEATPETGETTTPAE